MSLFAAPRIDMREDYHKFRRFQRALAALSTQGYRPLDREIMAEDDSHPIPVRIFEPANRRRDDILLFFHGGGWVIGDIESYTPACITMADLTGAVVASVDYRLAPEHPFPAGLQDCYRVAHLLLDDPELAEIADADRIVLIGDSAGANLAAVVSLMLRDRGQRGADRQILLYPVTYWDHDPKTSPFASVREHGADYRLTNTEVQEYLELYTHDRVDPKDPRVAPLMATDLTRQPRTLVVTAELDLLRDEGEAYGRALEDAGNTVRIQRVSSALHGFITLPRFARPVRDGYRAINEFLDAVPTDARPTSSGPIGPGLQRRPAE